MNRHSSVRDLTAHTVMAQPSPPQLLMYLCGTASNPHKGLRAGGLHRGKLPMVCPACRARKDNP